MSWHLRLQDTFNQTGWSKAELHRRAEVSYDNVVKYLSGKVDQPRGDTLARLANALNIDPIWLETGIDPSEQTKMVKLAGYIGAGQAVEAIDTGGQEDVEAPASSPMSTVAARVKGESMLPLLRDGWTIYWSRHLPPSEMLNRLAVCQLADGRILVKTIRNGSAPGFYTLTSFNAEDIEDVVVDWAAPIDWIKPR